ncbi:DUF86 domain-containing protein [Arcobacter sp. FWKO B]|uniref:HepT-like ribonuclease domain-containing protein n=1 Tax=Arcobacter sp. FWKO B TaxID=2593672 RepID=UPI0018A37710|nr:HepT-like ribonuclease domain-containing protein [Arcobacter sp. FWKO B]QOG12930.1 DUF86 domain-containing protein [Arcobacter sp. FWKO B]
MYSEIEIVRMQSIYKKLNSVFNIIQRHGTISKALLDEEGQPAILMLLIACAEQFNKLNKMEAQILNEFNQIDIKGIISIRNFIAHDYDGVNLSIVEDSLRYGIPEIFSVVKEILAKVNS